MSKIGYLLVDGNSAGYFYNSGGKRLTIGDMPVHAIYGFLREIHRLHAIYGAFYNIIVLWDGASWRKLVAGDYKANREESNTPAKQKMLKLRKEYAAQRPAIKKALHLLGIPQVTAANMEADDLGAYFTRIAVKAGKKVILRTEDQDWLQLVEPGVTWYPFRKDNQEEKVTVDNFEAVTGYKDGRAFTQMKALAGDIGDNVSGVGGVGEKGAREFLNTFGSFAAFSNQCIDGTVDPTKLPKKFRNLALDEMKRIKFAHNMTLVDLYTDQRPDIVGMDFDKGAANLPVFRHMCDLFLFRSFTKDFDAWTAVFPAATPIPAAA